MKRSYSTLIILFLIFFISVKNPAQDTSSIFWEISGNNLSNSSYLFGTVHMVGESDFFLPEGLEEKFKNSKQLVLEIDMDAPDLAQKSQRIMFMPNKVIKDLFSENDYKIIEKFFRDSVGLPLSQLQQIKPIFLAQFLLPKIINEPMASYELSFVQMAGEQKKEIIGLETIEEQAKTLDKIPLERQAELILETITELDENKKLYRQLIDSYKKMNMKDFYKLMFKISREFEEFEEPLLISRNKNWIPKIEEIIIEKSSFIAVGALHLEGENGLVALLKSKGYQLKPLY